MSIQTISGKRLRAAILASGLVVIAAPQGASAGDLSAQQIIDGLKTSKTKPERANTASAEPQRSGFRQERARQDPLTVHGRPRSPG